MEIIQKNERSERRKMSMEEFYERVLIKAFESMQVPERKYMINGRLAKRKVWVCEMKDLRTIVKTTCEEYKKEYGQK
jgi:hypothetical protein